VAARCDHDVRPHTSAGPSESHGWKLAGRPIPFGSAVHVSTIVGVLACVTVAIVPAGAYVIEAQSVIPVKKPLVWVCWTTRDGLSQAKPDNRQG
jgi:hypothetical protein